MRNKEQAEDYRYFPEPDLVPIVVDPAWVEAIAKGLPELPDARKKRIMANFGLSAYDAEVITASRPMADYYDVLVAGWRRTESGGKLADGRSIETFERLRHRDQGLPGFTGAIWRNCLP